MKTQHELPSGYMEILHIDMQKDKKMMTKVNVISLIIVVVMVVAAIPLHFFVCPVSAIFDMSAGFGAYFLRWGIFLAGMILYLVLHELVHGITMKMYGSKKIKYGFTGMYAFAGSDDYYGKKPYLVIALAPIVVWGIVLAVLNFFVPAEYFWIVYFIQMINISGAAGDLYVTWKFSKLPKDILVRDYGVSMTVYSSEN